MNIVIPMAGRGSRFASARHDIPKPLIPVAGRPMVCWALDSLSGIPYTQLIFVALAAHEQAFGVTNLLRQALGSSISVKLIDAVTEGQLCTVLCAREWIDSEEDLLVASADTYVVSPLAEDIRQRPMGCRGLISVADLPGDRWSFARTDESDRVVEVAEKVRISDHASTGLYYFSSGREFVSAADEMIHNGEKTRGEYYVIPAYQKYLQRAWQVMISRASQAWDMGTPEALTTFESYLSTLAG